MKTLVIKSKNQSELKFISNLLKKLGVSVRLMDIDEIEDRGMSILLKQANRNKKVSRETIMKKLKSK